MKIQVPTISQPGRHISVETLVDILSPAWECQDVVALSFTECSFLSAEASALLAGLVYQRIANKLDTVLLEHTLEKRVHRNLSKMGFVELFTREECLSNENSIPIYHQFEHDLEGIVYYLERHVMSRSEMPEMNAALRKEIRRSFIEIFGNTFLHSGSRIGGLVCGQIYPNLKQIQLIFLDTGVGISSRVRAATKDSTRDDRAALYWAIQKGNSTLDQVDGPRGLGLYLVRKFLEVNVGEFHIYSNKGYYSERGGEQNPGLMKVELPGTLIDLRIQITPNISYALTTA